ncbi:hypothetical protein [Flavivirga jejuensis]|uniref:Uncharacterized protein n=1 Tax=Flavivirga jejuensis TaxID=870487 RepID=A0ABT8WSK0_9FLAO|nr:hypothetical protein [Flavivirga jejuensis]MDO5975851.1 hypothetical protein [Flavivirga jejuensis]
MTIKETFRDLYKSVSSNKSLLVLLLVTDFMFLILHTLYVHNIIDGNPYFSIELDLGYSEFYQYMKEFWIFMLFLFITLRKKHVIYFVWALFFLYLLLDDSLAIHENFGKYLKGYFNMQPRFNLRPQDFGEVLVSFSVGFLFLILFLFSYFRIDIKGKKVTKNIFVLVLLLVFFGVFIDLLHIAIPYHSNRFSLVEDGGEMFAMSLILCYAFYLNKE